MNGIVIWLTGLPGSGKTSIATAARTALNPLAAPVCILDGDVLRRGLSSDLGFGREGRREAVRRAAAVATLLSDQGVVVLVALVSPYRDDRDLARGRLPAGRFIEVYVDAPIATCEARDPKGHYRRASAGALTQFTGVDDPYEPPLSPEVHLLTADVTVDGSTAQLVDYVSRVLRAMGTLPQTT